MTVDTSSYYSQGNISVMFKEGVGLKKIEEILGDFEYRQSFPSADPDDPSANERELSRTYYVSVPVGEANRVIGELQKNYADYIEEAERDAIRDAIRSPQNPCLGCADVCDLGAMLQS